MSIATFSMYWILVGVFGWIVMFVYRILTEGLPKNLTIVQFISGFTIACIAGMLVFPMIGIILIKEKYEE